MLNKEDIIKFHTDGFAGPFDAFPGEKIQNYRNFLNSNFIEKMSGNSDYLSNVHVISKTVYDAVTAEPIKNAIGKILGENFLLWKASFVQKRPNEISDNIHWHQDSFYRQMHPYNALVVWLALDDATIQNGCVEVLPGTHWHDVPHVKLGGGYFPFGADPNHFDSKASTEKLICKAGQFFIFNERIIHKSEVNRSNEKRIALVGRFIGTNVYIKSPQVACILVNGEDNFRYNLTTKAPTEK